MDKNGRDALSKTIAMAQLAWFVLQIAARAHQNLAITELELTTAALASLNIAMYISWWSKPTDILCPTIVETRQLQEHIRMERNTFLTLRVSAPNNTAPSSFSRDHSATPADTTKLISPTVRMTPGTNVEVNLVTYYCKKLIDALRKTATFPIQFIKKLVQAIPGLRSQIARIRGIFSGMVRRLRKGSGSTPCEKMKHVVTAFAMTIFVIWHTIAHLFLAFIYYPTLAILWGGARLPSGDGSGKHEETTAPGRESATDPHKAQGSTASTDKPVTPKEVDEMKTFDLVFNKDALRLVMDIGFFCEDVISAPFLCLSAFSGAVFGAIHCLAWNFELPSYIEQALWRTCSSVIAGLCICIMTVSFGYMCMQIHRLPVQPSEDIPDGRPQDATRPGTDRCDPSQLGSRRSSMTEKTVVPRHKTITGSINRTEVACSALAVCFVSTRLTLLTLSIIGLRALPVSAFDTVQWSRFIPHI